MFEITPKRQVECRYFGSLTAQMEAVRPRAVKKRKEPSDDECVSENSQTSRETKKVPILVFLLDDSQTVTTSDEACIDYLPIPPIEDAVI